MLKVISASQNLVETVGMIEAIGEDRFPIGSVFRSGDLYLLKVGEGAGVLMKEGEGDLNNVIDAMNVDDCDTFEDDMVEFLPGAKFEITVTLP